MDGNFIVKPADPSVHQQVTFYTKVSAYGGATDFFGPFQLNIGCDPLSVSVTDNVAFSNSGEAKLVGDSVESVYTYAHPVST